MKIQTFIIQDFDNSNSRNARFCRTWLWMKSGARRKRAGKYSCLPAPAHIKILGIYTFLKEIFRATNQNQDAGGQELRHTILSSLMARHMRSVGRSGSRTTWNLTSKANMPRTNIHPCPPSGTARTNSSRNTGKSGPLAQPGSRIQKWRTWRGGH